MADEEVDDIDAAESPELEDAVKDAENNTDETETDDNGEAKE